MGIHSCLYLAGHALSTPYKVPPPQHAQQEHVHTCTYSYSMLAWFLLQQQDHPRTLEYMETEMETGIAGLSWESR